MLLTNLKKVLNNYRLALFVAFNEHFKKLEMSLLPSAGLAHRVCFDE